MDSKTNRGQQYRLGLDIGTNSIGWAAIRLDDGGKPCGVLDMGVRIFPDGRTRDDGPSNAATRRLARSQRRLRNRYLKRRSKLLRSLVDHGLMPAAKSERRNLAELDPYNLRAKALDGPLQPFELGRALFHLNQRRGFKSNRKTEKSEKDTGPAKEAARKLSGKLIASNARTLGEFLYQRRCEGQPVRFRNLNEGKPTAKYDLYPTRDMVLYEFNAIWEAQKGHHPDVMTDDAKDQLRDIIFRQRDITPPPVGKCTLDPARDENDEEGFRCAWAHPLAQRFRIWQEVRNLEVQETGSSWRPLSKEEGDKVTHALVSQKEVTFNRIRKLLGLTEVYFNLESEKRKKLLGDATAAKLSHKDLFGKSWRKLPLDRQIEIVDLLLGGKDDDDVIEWLTQHENLGREAAERVVSAFLPDGHCRLGLRAIRRLLPHMEEGAGYASAAKAARYDHSRVRGGDRSPDGRLPYYGEWLQDHLAGSGDPQDPPDKRWGRYPNPTVHVGLNELRLVVNALSGEYGTPRQIVVELARDLKNSKRRRGEIRKEQAANQKKNEGRDRRLKEQGLKPNYENRLKLRLWEELNPNNAADRCCPYTGKPISIHQLFSDEVEIDHLIPWKDSLDDSPSNKIVSFKSANQRKGKRTPHAAFSGTPDWEGISRRASKLRPNKRWRFGADALEHFEAQGGFLARQLNETAWLSRLAKEYLAAVVRPDNVWVIPGRLTSMIRHKWGLNELLPGHHNDVKKRTDHRHHAIDALVVALTDRSLVQRISSAYDEIRSKIRVPTPWEGFGHEQLRPFLKDLVISYKPGHVTPGKLGSTSGQLHNKTAYGLVEYKEGGLSKVVVRKKLSAFENRSNLKSVRSPTTKKALLKLWDRVASEGGKQSEIVAEFVKRAATEGVDINGSTKPVRSVRVEGNLTVVPVSDANDKVYKGYKLDNNAFADIWELRDKKSWQVVAVPTHSANQPEFDIGKHRPLTARGKYKRKPDPAAKWLMRLHKDDMGALGHGKDRRIVRVRKFNAGTVVLDSHTEANVDARERNGDVDRSKSIYSARRLRLENFRKIGVDAIGRVRDPGPRK